METAINFTAIIVSFLALIMAFASLAISLGTKWSTHRIEWRPLETNDPFKQIEEEENTEASSDEEFLSEAFKLAGEGKKKKKKKEEDPLEFLEGSNF